MLTTGQFSTMTQLSDLNDANGFELKGTNVVVEMQSIEPSRLSKKSRKQSLDQENDGGNYKTLDVKPKKGKKGGM